MTNQQTSDEKFERCVEHASQQFANDLSHYGVEGGLCLVASMLTLYGSVDAVYTDVEPADETDPFVMKTANAFKEVLRAYHAHTQYTSVSERDVEMYMRYYYGTDN